MAIKKKTARKKARKKPGVPARITPRNQELIDVLCQVPAPSVKEAAKSLNMSYGSARQMLIKPIVFEALEAARAKISAEAQKHAGVDKTFVLKGAKEMFERCMQHEPVYDKDGRPVLVELPGGEFGAAYVFDSAGAGKALKLMGEHIEVNAFKALDDDGKPIDQNWRVTFVDAATGKSTVKTSASSK